MVGAGPGVPAGAGSVEVAMVGTGVRAESYNRPCCFFRQGLPGRFATVTEGTPPTCVKPGEIHPSEHPEAA